MIDHCFLSVNDWKKSRNFYDATLKILGYERILTFEIDENMAMAGYGSNKKSAFWIEKSPGITLSKEGGKARGVGIAFAAPSVEAIHAWFDACLSHGATEDGGRRRRGRE